VVVVIAQVYLLADVSSLWPREESVEIVPSVKPPDMAMFALQNAICPC
jgi:hypothetical protein